MSQSLHVTPTPHFGCHFDGRMNVKPFAQQQEEGGLNLNREKSVAHVAGAAEYGKEDVRVDIDYHNQQQKKGQGFETRKSLAAEVEAEHESDHADDNDVKPFAAGGQQQEGLNNTTKTSSTFGKYRYVPSFEEELLHDNCCNACRLARGGPQARLKAHFLHIAKQSKDELTLKPTFCGTSLSNPSRGNLPKLPNAPLKELKHIRRQGKQSDRANSIPLNRRLPERPKFRPPIDPQKAKENFNKNRPYMMRSD